MTIRACFCEAASSVANERAAEADERVKKAEAEIARLRRHLAAYKMFSEYDKRRAEGMRVELQALRAWREADQKVRQCAEELRKKLAPK